MNPLFATSLAVAATLILIIAMAFDAHDKKDALRRKRQREIDAKNRRAYELNRSTRWNG